MNRFQFAKVLKAALPYYKHRTTTSVGQFCMCWAIQQAMANGEITAWEEEKAIKKIEHLLFTKEYPYVFLKGYLRGHKGINDPESKHMMAFWKPHLNPTLMEKKPDWFAKTLTAGLKYYYPNTKYVHHPSFMCHAIGQVRDYHKISITDKNKAQRKIARILHPHNTLANYLRANYKISNYRSQLKFWENLIKEHGG